MKYLYLFIFALLVASCTDYSSCNKLKKWQGDPQQTPLGTVQYLRYCMCTENYTEASKLLSADFLNLRPGNPSKEAYWKANQTIQFEDIFYPLGESDGIVGELPTTNPNKVQVELNHERRLEKDARPIVLILVKTNGKWFISSWNNY